MGRKIEKGKKGVRDRKEKKTAQNGVQRVTTKTHTTNMNTENK